MENNKFYYHYTEWKKQTQCISGNIFDNRHFRAICNLDGMTLSETLQGIRNILNNNDDWIVCAIDKILIMSNMQSPVETNGFVSLNKICDAWRIVLNKII